MTSSSKDKQTHYTHNLRPDEEARQACTEMDPSAGYVRSPPPPHVLGTTYLTPDDQLFQTTHMGVPVIDLERYKIIIDGLVRRPLCITLDQLKKMPSTTITSFHECYGPPSKPPTDNYWRVGNLEWTGVRLEALLSMAGPFPEATFVWSDGLDRGTFAGTDVDRYQKDLLMAKAMSDDVLLAYEMNGQPLTQRRGGPVRLVVPGWFGTNWTKWLCRISVQDRRSPSLFTTKFYNEKDPTDPNEGMRPVWMLEPNSMIVCPAPDSQIKHPRVEVSGWAWSTSSISRVAISVDGEVTWVEADVQPREDFSWQAFNRILELKPGKYQLMARAKSISGLQQPLSGRRNHVHTIEVDVI